MTEHTDGKNGHYVPSYMEHRAWLLYSQLKVFVKWRLDKCSSDFIRTQNNFPGSNLVFASHCFWVSLLRPSYGREHCVTTAQLTATLENDNILCLFPIAHWSHGQFAHLFHLSFSTGEVLVHRQAVEEDLERLVHLAHLMQHHGFPIESLSGKKTAKEKD